ncbi:MAG: VOC family protein [Acidimicrobiales bacterium]
MEVLSARTLLRPRDLDRSLAFYGEVLALAVYRQFGGDSGDERGTVFFTGGGLLEVSGRCRTEEAAGPHVALWLQVRDVAGELLVLGSRGVTVLREPTLEPWGLVEAWIADPDGVRICVVEVPDDHPLRRRP